MNKAMVDPWIEKARIDLDSCHLKYNSGDPKFADGICFEAHEATEKILKAYLVACRIPFISNHDVMKFLEQAMMKDSSFFAVYPNCSRISHYGPKVRYPNIYNLTLVNARNAIDDSVAVYNFTYQKIQEQFDPSTGGSPTP